MLLGNYNALYKTLYKMSTDHFMEMDEDIDEVLEQTHINLQVTTTMFMQTKYLKWVLIYLRNLKLSNKKSTTVL